MIGERISELRKEMGLTQKELADMLSVSKYTISSYETDRTSPDDHNKILLAQIFPPGCLGGIIMLAIY